jgi:hypothetical protein
LPADLEFDNIKVQILLFTGPVLNQKGHMKELSSPQKDRYGWRDLYVSALFENNKAKLAEKIADAQSAIVARRQELFMSGNDRSEIDPRERQILDTALLSLQALANCLAITPRTTAPFRAA